MKKTNQMMSPIPPVEVFLEPLVCYQCGQEIGERQWYKSAGDYKGPHYHLEHAPPGYAPGSTRVWYYSK